MNLSVLTVLYLGSTVAENLVVSSKWCSVLNETLESTFLPMSVGIRRWTDQTGILVYLDSIVKTLLKWDFLRRAL